MLKCIKFIVWIQILQGGIASVDVKSICSQMKQQQMLSQISVDPGHLDCSEHSDFPNVNADELQHGAKVIRGIDAHCGMFNSKLRNN